MITTTDARAVVREANTTGKCITVTLDTGDTHTGTARFSAPLEASCQEVMLFAATTANGSTVPVHLSTLTDITVDDHDADPTVGTTVSAIGLPVPDPRWSYGTGLE